MGEILLKKIVSMLDEPSASQLTLTDAIFLVNLASRLKDDILLTQPANISASGPPDILPPSIVHFLSESCNLSPSSVDSCWHALKAIVWHNADSFQDRAEAAFVKHGHCLGLTSHTIYPPTHTCRNPHCSRTGKGLLLKKTEVQQSVLYTLDQGPIPVYSVQLGCEGKGHFRACPRTHLLPVCHITYHHNFQVDGDHRIYYDGLPDILQVGIVDFLHKLQNFPMACRLGDINLLNVASSRCGSILCWFHGLSHPESIDNRLIYLFRTSATNCARLYNISLSEEKAPPDGWAFGFTLTSEHVWDGFIILSLLEDCKHRQQTLVVPNGGVQKDRFTAAIRARNTRIRLYGQPELRHHCRKCVRLYTDNAGQVARKVWVVVIDGVTIGHPCCGIHNCFTQLASNRHRFCPTHAPAHEKICAVVGCDSPTVMGSLVCTQPTHQDIERIHRERGQARFQLKERLERARAAHPNDAFSEDSEWANDLEDHAVDGEAFEPVVSNQKRIRAKFTRSRTHNEQVITAPCGMIIARETFYGAEGAASVVDMVKRTFRGDLKPDHIFYDNNCTLAKMVKDDPFFRDIGLTVDVFHFKSKHTIADTFCQLHCNPAAFPELASDDGKGWFFNSSIAEQTNVWIGGYQSMCREMLVDKYNFFLDEMIIRRNRLTRAKLQKQGHFPDVWPLV